MEVATNASHLQDATSVGSSASKKSASHNTIATASSSSASSSSSPPSSPSSFTRRRRSQNISRPRAMPTSQQTTTHQDTTSSLFVLQERRPPEATTATTVTAFSGPGLCSSSDGEDEQSTPMDEGEGVVEMTQRPLNPDHEMLLSSATSAVVERTDDLEMGVEPDEAEPLSPTLSPLSGPLSPQLSSSHRRGPTSRPPSVSSISTSSFRSRRSRNGAFDSSSQPQQLAAASSTSGNNNHGRNKPSGANSPSLRASLDAGMAAVRSWIRSRGNNAPSSRNNDSDIRTSDSLLRPRSRSVTWQTSPSLNSSASVASYNTSASGELDDLLHDDLSTRSNNSASTDNSHLSSSSSRYRPASVPTVFLHRHQRQPHRPRMSSIHYPIQSHPDTILEELDEAGADGHMMDLRSRKRTQSEPDGRHIPDIFMGPAPSTRYHNAPAPRQRRRNMNTLFNNYHAHHPQYHSVQQQEQSPEASPRRINLARRPRIESDLGTSLSSSAAAALYDNPNHQSSSNSSLMPQEIEFSDAGASVATTTATAALEHTGEPATFIATANETTTAAAAGSAVSPLSSTAATPTSTISPVRNGLNGGGGGNSVAVSQQSVASPTAANAPTTPVQRQQSHSQVTDSERQARIRWIRINRRFQFVITVVALLFSLLLFGILICWVVLTSAYVLSFDKQCDVHLKRYFWLVTLQLVLDVFRSDIMRVVFQWDANSNRRIPARVIAYNLTYLVYALLVLRLGVRSVFFADGNCRKTAPELFNASTAFVSLSIAAWATIVCGYLLPFCVVAILLTCNGYNPTSHNRTADESIPENGAAGAAAGQPVFPAAYATTGAPPGTIDLLNVVRYENVRENSRECCICMEEFTAQDVLVETSCKHVFHKQCCREWLRIARTCPVCRTDIATQTSQEDADPSSRIPIGPTGRPVVGLFRILRRTTNAALRAFSTTSVPSDREPSNGRTTRASTS